MDNSTRICLYTRVLTGPKYVDGFARLTPKQRRRAKHKYRREIYKPPKNAPPE